MVSSARGRLRFRRRLTFSPSLPHEADPSGAGVPRLSLSEVSTVDRALERYSRQILFPAIGAEGQRKISGARVLIVGSGALGTNIANTMARAGVGRLRIVDRDFVEESNLQRQCLFDEADAAAGLPKAVAVERKLRQINSTIAVEGVVADVNFTNVEGFVREADLVLDGMDNFEARFLVNDACVKHGVPWIYGGCVGSSGMTMNILPYETPCLRCVWEDAPPPGTTPTADTAGIIGPIPSVVAALECAEALKVLVGDKAGLSRDLITIDLWPISVARHPVARLREAGDCPACKHGRFDSLKPKNAPYIVSLCGREAVQIVPCAPKRLDLAGLADALGGLGRVVSNPYLVRFWVGDFEMRVFTDGRAVIKGTRDFAVAQGLYAKHVRP
jgi:adenylyltransferase/sulfurtransferase